MMGVNGHRRKRIGGVPKVPRAHETGREPNEQRGQHTHHHQQPDDIAQRDYRYLGHLFANACAQGGKIIKLLLIVNETRTIVIINKNMNYYSYVN